MKTLPLFILSVFLIILQSCGPKKSPNNGAGNGDNNGQTNSSAATGLDPVVCFLEKSHRGTWENTMSPMIGKTLNSDFTQAKSRIVDLDDKNLGLCLSTYAEENWMPVNPKTGKSFRGALTFYYLVNSTGKRLDITHFTRNDTRDAWEFSVDSHRVAFDSEDRSIPTYHAEIAFLWPDEHFIKENAFRWNGSEITLRFLLIDSASPQDRETVESLCGDFSNRVSY